MQDASPNSTPTTKTLADYTHWFSAIVASAVIHVALVFLISYSTENKPKIDYSSSAPMPLGIKARLANIQPPKSAPTKTQTTKAAQQKDLKAVKKVTAKPTINTPKAATKQPIKPVIKPVIKKPITAPPIKAPTNTVAAPKIQTKNTDTSSKENNRKSANTQKTPSTQVDDINKTTAADNLEKESAEQKTENSLEKPANEAASSLTDNDDKARTADYKRSLTAWLEKHKDYPNSAKRRRQEDEITLEFTINAKGDLLSHRLINPSRYTLLNNAVEKMIKKASPLPAIPQDLKNKKTTFTYSVSIAFNLR